MTTWYCKALGDGGQAFEPSRQIQETFLPLFAAAGNPPDMAVFSLYDVDANVVTAYFSPGASDIARMFGAQPCKKPTSERIGLLVGDARAWDLFFPNRPKNE
jgi:hypothetical protein